MRLISMTVLLFGMLVTPLLAQATFTLRPVDDGQTLLTWAHSDAGAQCLQRLNADGTWATLTWDIPPHREPRGFYIDQQPQRDHEQKVHYRLHVYALKQSADHVQSETLDDTMAAQRLDLPLAAKRWLVLKAISNDTWGTPTQACWANAAIWTASGSSTFLSDMTPSWVPDFDWNQAHNTRYNWQTQTGKVRIPWDGYPHTLSSLLPGMFVFDLSQTPEAQVLRTHVGVAMNRNERPSNKAIFSIASLPEQPAQTLLAESKMPNRTKSPGNTTYYLNTQTGNDSADGTTPQTAWQTLLPLNSIQLAPGDRVYFQRGQHFTGPLHISSSGSTNAPITFTSAGDGDVPACIDGDGYHNQAIRVDNAQHLVLEQLEITSRFAAPRPRAAGIRIAINDMGVARNITLRNLNIHDVDGHPDKKLGFPSAGICMEVWGRESPGSYDNLLIENNTITRTGRDGILLFSIHGNRDAGRKASTRVVVRNNELADIPGDGISLCVCDNALIQHNTLTRIATAVSHHNAACGIWPWSSDNTLIQFNEVSHCGINGHDGQALDADWNCNNTVFQYNYTHDNPNGALLICSKPKQPGSVGNVRPVYRYNLSVNDGQAKSVIRIGGDASDVKIHDNIFIAQDRMQWITLAHWNGAMPKNLILRNNRVITPTDSSVGCILSDKTAKDFQNNRITTGTLVEGARQAGIIQTPSDQSLDQWLKYTQTGKLLEQLVQLGQQEQNKPSR